MKIEIKTLLIGSVIGLLISGSFFSLAAFTLKESYLKPTIESYDYVTKTDLRFSMEPLKESIDDLKDDINLFRRELMDILKARYK